MIDTVAVNGEVRRMQELRLGDFLHSFFFGAGFFETFLIEEGVPWFLARHLTRLRTSLAAYADTVRAPPAPLLEPEAVLDALRRCLAVEDMGPRFTGVGKLVAGDGQLLLTFRPRPAPASEGLVLDQLESRGYRRGDPLATHKSVSYLRQYSHLGRGTVFANEHGEWCEAPNGNLFFLLEDAVVTPPVEAPCLPGIIRAVVVEAGPWEGLPIEERALPVEQRARLQGCVLTNSVGLVQPVSRLLGQTLPHSTRLAQGLRARVEARARQET
ncbi:aminotransferase class IV [Melittangium boletus]|uniref:aminotransferase class IV n=1 Tax=Melittangium boletus TaxID=83453 RepID=UPI003DA3AC5A